MQRYPTLIGVLGALHVFESAARLKSFTKAAQELSLTQPAVSRRISALEERLNLFLFERNHNKLQLTADGRELLSAVEISLDHLNSVTSQLTQKSDRRKLTIACGFSFSSMWLQSRFSRLRKMLDGIELRLIASEFPEVLDPKMIDIRILWGEECWLGREMRPLFSDDIFPVCSPQFAAKQGFPQVGELAPESFRELPLLYSQSSGSDRLDWEEWFRALKIGFVPEDLRYVYDTYQFTIQAAIEGEGIALGYSGLIDDSLKRGELIRIGQSISHQTGATFIEFETNRIPASRRNQIYDWFQSEIASAE